jgi:hypothetical protein
MNSRKRVYTQANLAVYQEERGLSYREISSGSAGPTLEFRAMLKAIGLGEADVLLELGKALSFFLSILSLYALMASAFFVPGSRWDERLAGSLLRIAVAACVCFASGLLFRQSAAAATTPENPPAPEEPPVIQTLPVRLFFWALSGMALLFFLSWYLEEYYVPLLWKNQPH